MTADRAQQNIESLIIKAPMDGVVSVRENMDAAGGVLLRGHDAAGVSRRRHRDPGRPVIDIFDISSMEIRARVNEQERANIVAGAGRARRVERRARRDARRQGHRRRRARPARQLRGPAAQFEVTLELDTADPRLRPGTSVTVLVQGQTVDNVLLLPRQAVFEKDGKPIVYERTPAGLRAEAHQGAAPHGKPGRGRRRRGRHRGRARHP